MTQEVFEAVDQYICKLFAPSDEALQAVVESIEKNNIPRLFERFFRVDKSGARAEGGSGLGLSIVKHIIEAHDEKIYVESKFGKGSEFSFTIEKA